MEKQVQHTALIVGGGIGGLAAAIALRRSGWSVRVLERSSTLEQTGFALALAPNAMAALGELGVADAIRPLGHTPGLAEVRRADGSTIRRFDARPFWRDDNSMVIVERPRLHECLMAAAGAERIEPGCQVSGFHASGDRVTVALADGRTMTADVLIGADGVGSMIRRVLHPLEPAPRPSGHWALRGLARGVTHRLGSLSALAWLGPGAEVAALRAGADAIYWYASLRSDGPPCGTLDPIAVLDQSPALQDPAFRAVADASSSGAIRLDQLFVRDPLPRWGDGPVTLLGDAAHPVLPHTGQGAAMALEDAVALGLALAGSGDVATNLRRYESVRRPLTARLIRRGPRIAAATTTDSRVCRTLRDGFIRAAPLGLLSSSARRLPAPDPHRRLRS